MSSAVKFDTLRSLGFGSISGTYAAIGTPFGINARIICITNTTDADMVVSTDPANSNGQLILIHGTFKLFDLTTNRKPHDDDLALSVGVQFYVKQVSAPSSGSMYVEAVYS